MRRRSTPGLAVTALLLVLAGCGGDSTDEAAGDASSEPSSSTSASASESSPPSESTPPSEATTEPSAAPEPSGADAAYCAEVADARKQLSAGAAADVGAAIASLEKITRLAPAGIRDQWQVVTSTVVQVDAAVRKAGLELGDLSDPEALAALTAKQRNILTDELQGLEADALPQANQDISAQVGEVCGIELSTDGALPTP